MLINQTVNKDSLSVVFAALADPTRRAILEKLSVNDASVNELAQPFDMSLPAISKHLKVLEQAGLISKSVVAQTRQCHLEAERLLEVNAWLDDYREFWQGNLDNLEQYLNELKTMQSMDQSTHPRRSN